jgi:hypothetical protein
MKTIRIILLLLFVSGTIFAQKPSDKNTLNTDKEQIKETLYNYMDGVANGEPEKLRKAFHPDFNLYTVTSDTLWIRSGQQYINAIKPGNKVNRIGRIISIDLEKDAAIAKGEIVVPGWRKFIDYFLLMKYQGSWKIVQKSYTWWDLPKD